MLLRYDDFWLLIGRLNMSLSPAVVDSFLSLLLVSKSLETQGTSRAHLMESLFSRGLRCETPKSELGLYFAL